MGFIGVYRAIYDYDPRAENELAIEEGDLLLVSEKGEDGWWDCKRISTDSTGLCAGTYLEEANVLHVARALYDYNRQTDEELSFTEDTRLRIYDVSDPDWTLAGLDDESYGFAPSNYLEIEGAASSPAPTRSPRAQTEAAQSYPSPTASPTPSPAAALAGMIHQRTGPPSPTASRSVPTPAAAQFTPEASDEEAPPSLPRRPPSQPAAAEPSGTTPAPAAETSQDDSSLSPGYQLYHILEMISHQGKTRKMPTTLGINVSRGLIMIAPAKSRDGKSDEWSAEKLDHYSLEGKHVFIELVRPSKSVDFHAGNKDTANEIVAALGELAGAARSEGLREVVAASAPGHKTGRMRYEFMAGDDSELTIAAGDEVVILDDTQSKEWWNVRRLKNGKEGAVPASHVELTGTTSAAPDTSGMSQKELNRVEEERMLREAMRASVASHKQETSTPSRWRSKRGSRSDSKSGSKPDSSLVRTWTDRSGSYKVEAQFIGLKDGKIHLHKTNTVKISVPVSKMSSADIEYVERKTGQSLDEDKPLSDIRRRNTLSTEKPSVPQSTGTSGAAVQASSKPEYDWFDFFLQCGVHPQICERYAGAFAKDQMGEENMQDIDPTLLRTLGVKEGDILRVMKFLDTKFGRTRSAAPNGESDTGGLFSGPGGVLKNNTRKGRPAAPVQSNQTVDSRVLEQSKSKELPPNPSPSPLSSAQPAHPQTDLVSGFDDNAWEIKPAKASTPPRAASPAIKAPQPKPPTDAMSELSLLSPPLQPKLAPAPQPAGVQTSKPTGADPLFFDNLVQPAANSRQQSQALQQSQNSNSGLPLPQRPGSAPQNQNAFGQPQLTSQVMGARSLAPHGQSLGELGQQRMQQSFGPMYPNQTGFANNTMMPQMTGMQQFPPGYGQQFSPQQQHQAFINGQQAGSPFADPHLQPQQTGYQPPPGPINNYLVQPLQPQPTGANNFQSQPQQFQNGMQPMPTGIGQNGPGFNQPSFMPQQLSQMPPMPPPPPQQQQQQQQTQPTPAPLQPQQTGPAPPVKFGVTATPQKLVPQPTGRANLAKATPQNPFGF